MPTKVGVTIDKPISLDHFYLDVPDEVAGDFDSDIDEAIEALKKIKNAFKKRGGLKGAIGDAAREALEATIEHDAYATLGPTETGALIIRVSSEVATITIDFDAAVQDLIDIIESSDGQDKDNLEAGLLARDSLRKWADKLDSVCVKKP